MKKENVAELIRKLEVFDKYSKSKQEEAVLRAVKGEITKEESMKDYMYYGGITATCMQILKTIEELTNEEKNLKEKKK